MGGFRGRTSVSVLVLTALLGSSCHVQLADEAAPDVATPRAISVEPPPDSTGATAAVAPMPTRAATLVPTSGVSNGTDDAATENVLDPPVIRPPLVPRDTSADVPLDERFVRAAKTALASSFPDRAFVLQAGPVRGDLSGDGIDDYVLHVIEETSDSLPISWLVPAVDAGGAFRLRSPIELGQNVIVDSFDILLGNIEISIFDRSPHEPPTVITRRTTLSISLDDPDNALTATRVEPIHNAPSLQIIRPSVPAAFELDSLSTAVSDRIELRERHPFVVHAAEDDVMVATLEAPEGVWLEARLDDGIVLVPVAEHTQRFATQLPAGGAWHVTVVSSLMEPADYRFSIEVYPPGLSDGIATRDLNGFWSGTPVSPPAVPDDGPVVYLTFDDGPHPIYTPRVLDVLAKHRAQATFFVVGYLAERWPLIVQRIAHEGHTLANHSWDHRSLAPVSRAAFDRSVGRTQEVLGPLATPCIRPPFYGIGTNTQQWAAEHGLKLAGWSYSPQDWLGPSARTIADGLVARSTEGAVLLLHDGGGNRSSTVRGLDMALERLADSGLEFKALCR